MWERGSYWSVLSIGIVIYDLGFHNLILVAVRRIGFRATRVEAEFVDCGSDPSCGQHGQRYFGLERVLEVKTHKDLQMAWALGEGEGKIKLS